LPVSISKFKNKGIIMHPLRRKELLDIANRKLNIENCLVMTSKQYDYLRDLLEKQRLSYKAEQFLEAIEKGFYDDAGDFF
jgi:hypothetical protein